MLLTLQMLVHALGPSELLAAHLALQAARGAAAGSSRWRNSQSGEIIFYILQWCHCQPIQRLPKKWVSYA